LTFKTVANASELSRALMVNHSTKLLGAAVGFNSSLHGGSGSPIVLRQNTACDFNAWRTEGERRPRGVDWHVAPPTERAPLGSAVGGLAGSEECDTCLTDIHAGAGDQSSIWAARQSTGAAARETTDPLSNVCHSPSFRECESPPNAPELGRRLQLLVRPHLSGRVTDRTELPMQQRRLEAAAPQSS
jgi:hypothetical protein